MRVKEKDVKSSEEGIRLDVFLVRHYSHMSRSRARSLISEGKVWVDGKKCSKGTQLKKGSRIKVEENITSRKVVATSDPDIQLKILYQDMYVVVVEKAAGMPCHPLKEGEKGTVVSGLVASFPEMASIGYHPREPGLVHRLDNQTSGILLAARREEAFQQLKRDLEDQRIEKRYIGLCEGEVEAGRRIETVLQSDRRNRRKMRVITKGKGRTVTTEIIKSKKIGRYTILEIGVNKAARHQIRAHLSFIGHPLVGDHLYHGQNYEGFNRHFLHASEIWFRHPITKKKIHLLSGLPSELRKLVNEIRNEE